jgi:hypothetical protein
MKHTNTLRRQNAEFCMLKRLVKGAFKTFSFYVSFEVLTAMTTKSMVFWVVTPRSSELPKRRILSEMHDVTAQKTYSSGLRFSRFVKYNRWKVTMHHIQCTDY